MLEILKHNMLRQAVQIVRDGGVIIYPTDTVWGLGCDALNAAAVNKLRAIKQKPADSKLIWLLPSVKAVRQYCGSLTPAEIKLLNHKRTTVLIHGQAVRVVRNGWLHQFLRRCGVPLVSTSANRHGAPVVSSWRQAAQVFAGAGVTIIRGRRVLKSVPSTLAAVAADGQIKILRAGHGICIK